MIPRRSILKTLGFAGMSAGVHMIANLESLLGASSRTADRLPVLFVGHGNPMNAITANPFAVEWETIGRNLPKPRAIVCISAHWETPGTRVTAMPKPPTIHDFGGFPDALFAVQYPAPGSPEIALEVSQAAIHHTIAMDHEWGLDHGAWSVLKRMFPLADIPVLQLSLDVNLRPEQHVALARDMASLRSRGILFVGSGNIVHNLRRISWDGQELDWAREFDALSTKLIEQRDIVRLADYASLGEAARLSVPTTEHYLPMLYSLAMAHSTDDLRLFNQRLDLGSVSMTSFIAA